MTDELDRAFGAIAARRARAHPGRTFGLIPLHRAYLMWFNPHAQGYTFEGNLFPLRDLDAGRFQHLWLPLFSAIVAFLSIAGTAGGVLLAIQRGTFKWAAIFFLLVLTRLAVGAMILSTEVRYTIQIFPPLIVTSAIFMARRRSSTAEAAVRRLDVVSQAQT